MALHASAPGFTRSIAVEQLRARSAHDEIATWWYGGGHLYEVFLQPINYGSATEGGVLGVLAVGYEVDERLTREVSRIAGSEVSITYGDAPIVSTLRPAQESAMAAVRRGAPLCRPLRRRSASMVSASWHQPWPEQLHARRRYGSRC